MIKLKDLIKEEIDIEFIAKSKGFKYKTYRGDVFADEIFVYTPKERREHGIFTTPIQSIADIYSKGKKSRMFYVKSQKTLDLTKDNMENMKWVEKWGENFDEWIDRQSGEETYAWDVLQSGQLFDYEGDWSSERWIDIQQTAENSGYDSVILPDYDSSYGVFPSFVVFDEHNLKLADPITYDDHKREIPINLRFDSTKNDIRY